MTLPGPSPGLPKDKSGDKIITRESLGARILEAEPGHVHIISGLDARDLQDCLERVSPADKGPLALFLRLREIAPADAVIEDLVAQLAGVALQLWPVWYGDVDLSDSGNATLERAAGPPSLAEAARKNRRISREWVRAAAALALEGKIPRPEKLHWSIECAQLCQAISPSGLVLVLDREALPEPPEAHALVHALELVASKAKVAVVLLCARLPAFEPPYERILIDAGTVEPSCGSERPPPSHGLHDEPRVPAILVPISGRPHPLSEVEKMVAKAIAAAADLAAFFCYNQVVETVRGSRPKVDLLWREGRLIVELDGYHDHSRRDMFVSDRHRDYELTLSGYTILRLPNEEVLQDVEKAVDKIRDVVAFLTSKSKWGA